MPTLDPDGMFERELCDREAFVQFTLKEYG